MTLEDFHFSTFFETFLLPLGWVWVIIWCQYGYLSAHESPCSGHWAHLARSMAPLKASKLLFAGGPMAFGVCTNKQFSTLRSSKMEIFLQIFFDIVTTHNDEICYVKHVLDPL